MITAILQCRLGSKRLPNKALLQIPPGSGVSMLEMCIRKAMLATLVDDVIVVTPDNKIAQLCEKWNIRAYLPTWEKRDVLREYYIAALTYHAETIVRVTADCPLIRPEIIDEVIQAYLDNECFLAYNTDERHGQLDGEGSDVEVFAFDALREAFNCATEGYDREHCTGYIRKNMDCLYVESQQLGIRSVNTWQDYVWVCNYSDYLSPIEP